MGEKVHARETEWGGSLCGNYPVTAQFQTVRGVTCGNCIRILRAWRKNRVGKFRLRTSREVRYPNVS